MGESPKSGTGLSEPPETDKPIEQSSSLKEKAYDLEAIRTTAIDSAGVTAAIWLSYLFVLFYLFVAASGVTHRDLFLANPVKLPFLSIDLPLTGFFWLGPALFLIVHAYVLVHVVLMSSIVTAFGWQVDAQVDDEDVNGRLRRNLPINIFIQLLAGAPETRQGPLGFLLRTIVLITLMIGPVALLVFFEIRFLPFHDPWLSWWHRIAVVLDLILLWSLWPAFVRGHPLWPAWWGFGWDSVTLSFTTIVSVLFVFCIATFPGEWLEAAFAWFPLRQELVAGDVDLVSQKPTSLWANRLVLPGIDIVDHTKFDTNAKVIAAPPAVSLRSRHFEDAILIRANLPKVDLSGAYLQGAQLNVAQMQGATLDGADLAGARFIYADLEGASLANTNAPGASFSHSNLQGGTLDGGLMQAASFEQANLQGASFYGTNLNGSSFEQAQLQGASFVGSKLRLTSFGFAFVWRSFLDDNDTTGAVFTALQTAPQQICENFEPVLCSAQGIFDVLVPMLSQYAVWGDIRKPTLRRLKSNLDPRLTQSIQDGLVRRWSDLQSHSQSLDRYKPQLAELWHQTACYDDDGPYIVEGLAFRLRNGESPFTVASSEFSKIAANFLTGDCRGSRGISQATISELIKLRDLAPPTLPSPNVQPGNTNRRP